VAFVLTHNNPLSRAAPARDGPTNLVRDETAAPGTVLAFGDARFFGPEGKVVRTPVVAMAATPDGAGYWLVGSDGGVLSFGDAHLYGSAGSPRISPIVGMAPTPDGHGYWLVDSDGSVLGFGDAHLYGLTGATPVGASAVGGSSGGSIVGIAATPDGEGYWLVGANGGVLGFGDAHYYGSTGGKPRRSRVTGIAATPDGGGYWLVGSDGTVLSFGDAHYYGSTGGKALHAPIVAMAPTVDGRGYWLVASDGAVLSFGDAHFFGSGAGKPLAQPVVAASAAPEGGGYWLVEGERPPTPAVSLFTPALDASLEKRTGIISAAVLDLRNGNLYTYRPGEQLITASVVKVQILGALLVRAQNTGQPLSAADQDLATDMIELSDNDDATALWNELGGAPTVAAFDRSVGMLATTPNLSWGLTTTTATDQVELLEHLVEPNDVLSDASRAYILQLMERVAPFEEWGASAGAPAGTTVALKNGWLPWAGSWAVNSIGWVDGSERDYLMAVLTSGSPDEAYGIATIGMVGAAAWSALGPS
jgi:beta-lactamase class A/ribosomal protein L24E